MTNLVDKLYWISFESVNGCDTNNSMDILHLLRRVKLKDTKLELDTTKFSARYKMFKV